MQVLARIGGTALRAFSAQVDTVANNIANVNTRDYVRKESVFTGLISNELSQGITPVLKNGSIGHTVAITERHDFRSPGLIQTGNPLDLALERQGFYRFELDGEVFYSNRGQFSLDGEGRLVHSSGAVVPDVVVPQGSKLFVDRSGQAWLISEGERIQSGRLDVVTFVNPQGLQHTGGGCFVATEASGEPQADLGGQVLQSHSRLPSVDLAEEMTRIITAQRAYQLNARTVRTADEMWERINDLKR